MKTTSGIIFRLVLITIVAALLIVTLSGCVESVEAADEAVRSLFRIQDNLSDSQTRWIIVWETLLLVFLALLIVLLIALFRRYRKTEKRAYEAGVRERTLMRENEMLDRLSRMKTEFIQNMSHDFRTPLTVISTSVLNAVDVLDFDMDKDEIRESLTLAQSEIMRMSRIVEGALKHAALHGNQQSSESLDLTILLRKVVKTYQAFLERRGNTLSMSVSGELPHVYGNADMLLNVLANLISNADRYTRNGEIVMSAKVSDDNIRFVMVTVSDNGTGVNPEVLSNIFKRGTSEASTGLGLHICKSAVESHGGTITVESEEGKGTMVAFTVPVYDVSIGDSEEGVENV